MEQLIIQNETVIRLAFFGGIFFFIASWEIIAPRRELNFSKGVRWYSNLLIVVINSLSLRFAFPVLAVAFAALARSKGWGLFNNIGAPEYIRAIVSLLFLDCVIYLQHVMFHSVPLLWKLHRMHHADLDIDVTTGARFHPIEIILSMLIKIAAISIIGPPVYMVVVFEVVLNGAAMFNHGNIYIPPAVDKYLRWFIVTPDMHRVHHSDIMKETNSNYGFNVPWWDRIFGTYRAQPEKGHLGMTIGLKEFRDPRNLHIHQLLVQPFIKAE